MLRTLKYKLIPLVCLVLTVSMLFGGCLSESAGDSHVHSYGEWVEPVSATCTADGSLGYYHCDECGKYFDENNSEMSTIIDVKTGHTFDVKVESAEALNTAGDCQTKQVFYYSCSCGAISDTLTFEGSVDMTKHNNLSQWVITSDGDCIEKGERQSYCLDCHTKITETTEINADKHVFSVISTEAATCTKGEKKTLYCFDCKEVFTSDSGTPDPTKHNFGEGVETDNPDESDVHEKVMRATCDECKSATKDTPLHECVDYVNGGVTLDKCSLCNVLDNAPNNVDIRTGKYADSFGLFIQGADIDVVYSFTNISGNDARWQNFIIDIQPAVMFSDGKIYNLYNSDTSKFPILPYFNSDYYATSSNTKHNTGFKTGFGVNITSHSGTYGLVDKNGGDLNETAFAQAMAEGVDVTVHITRNDHGAVNMTVDYVTHETEAKGHLEVTYGFEGFRQLYLGLTGEKCLITDLVVKVNKGEMCSTSEGTSVLNDPSNCSGTKNSDGSITFDNNGTKNVQNAQYRLKGDYEAEIQFTMSSTTAMSSANSNGWHTWLLYFYANEGSVWDHDWDIVGNGIEAIGAGLDHGHSSNLWAEKNMNMNCTAGYDKRSAVYGATVTLRISRKNGYITVFGIAEKEGVVTAYYSFYSKDLNYTDNYSKGKLWDKGTCTAASTIHITSEQSAVKLTKFNVISGEYYKQ